MRLCVIPVRSGSKGLKHKNIHPFLGQPLLAHSVRQALDAGVFDSVAVSSDEPEYLEIAKTAGADRLIERPGELADDTASSLSVLRHALACVEKAEACTLDNIALLQATSPVRRPEHIAEAMTRLDASTEAGNIISVTATKDGPWTTLVAVDPEGWAQRLLPIDIEISRRQLAPEAFRINGSIYIWRRAMLLGEERLVGQHSLIYPMPALYSWDIDNLEDLLIAEFVATKLLRWKPA